MCEKEISLPEKSKGRYELVYKSFKEWCEAKGENGITENVVLAYFMELAKVKKPSSLWAVYSMLRKTVEVHDDMDISRFSTLCSYLRKMNVGYEAKKSSIFTALDIENFVDEAPLDLLPHKVALIIGISGACRSDELLKMKTTDLDFFENKIIVTIPNTISLKSRAFIITNPKWIKAINDYMDLRKNIDLERLFVQLRCGKATRQPFGHNAIGQFPKKIAGFLKLKTPESYTGHCYRRTAATLIAANGNDILQLRKLSNWRNNGLSENYIETVLESQIKSARFLSNIALNGSERIVAEAPSTSNNQNVSLVNFEVGRILLTSESCDDPEAVKHEEVMDQSVIKSEIEDYESADVMENDDVHSLSCGDTSKIHDEFTTFSEHIATQLRLLPLEAALKLEIRIQEMIYKERIAQAGVQRSIV